MLYTQILIAALSESNDGDNKFQTIIVNHGRVRGTKQLKVLIKYRVKDLEVIIFISFVHVFSGTY